MKSAKSPRWYFGMAAAAIMAALSVERPGVGKSTGYGRAADSATRRRPELHATPPEIIIERAPIASAAEAARFKSSSITVF